MTPPITTPAAETATKSRRVYSAQEKIEFLALFEQSAMSPADFCREMTLNEATFSFRDSFMMEDIRLAAKLAAWDCRSAITVLPMQAPPCAISRGRCMGDEAGQKARLTVR